MGFICINSAAKIALPERWVSSSPPSEPGKLMTCPVLFVRPVLADFTSISTWRETLFPWLHLSDAFLFGTPAFAKRPSCPWMCLPGHCEAKEPGSPGNLGKLLCTAVWGPQPRKRWKHLSPHTLTQADTMVQKLPRWRASYSQPF